MRLETALAIALHIVCEHRVEQQRHVPEQVVEDVGLDDVVELLRRANPVGDRKLAVGQQGEERHLGDQPWHGHQLPAGGAVKPLVHFIEARDPVALAQGGQGVDERLAGQARQQPALAFVQAPVGVVVGLGVGRVVLSAGVVSARAGIVAARWALAGAVDNGFNGHGASVRGQALSAASTPRRIWSRSSDSNSALKLPSPKPSR